MIAFHSAVFTTTAMHLQRMAEVCHPSKSFECLVEDWQFMICRP